MSERPRDDEVLRDPDSVEVRNAADPRQVRRAKRRDNAQERLEDERMRAALRDGACRAVFLDVLRFCRVFESIWTPGDAIHYNAGQQDVGHYLMARIERASPEALFAMMTEAKQAEVARAHENVASRTRAATEESDET